MSKKCQVPENEYLVEKLKEWEEEVLAKMPTSKLPLTITRAIKSIRLHCLEITSGAQSLALEYIGDFIAEKIDKIVKGKRLGRKDSVSSSSGKVGASQDVGNIAAAASIMSSINDIEKMPSNLKNSQPVVQLMSNLKKAAASLVSNRAVFSPSNIAASKSVPSASVLDPGVVEEEVVNNKVKRKKAAAQNDDEIEPGQPKRKVPKPKSYVPAYGSAPYAIILSLYDAPSYSLHKADLLEAVKKYTSVEMVSTAQSHYAGWNSMATLIKKLLVLKTGMPARYSLTDAGVELASGLAVSIADMTKSVPKENNPSVKSASTLPKVVPVVSASKYYDVASDNSPMDDIAEKPESVQPAKYKSMENFDIFIVLDCRETGTNRDRSVLSNSLTLRGINCISAQLSIGDVCWIAKPRNGGDSIVLDCIVERKKIPDFESSIIDTRYKEQKHRLSLCGLSRIFYLVEGDMYLSSSSKEDLKRMETAIASTECLNGFLVYHTASQEGTINFLQNVTNQLLKECQTLGVPNNVTMPEFQLKSKKSADTSLFITFAKQLKMISGIGAEKAVAIAEDFPTFRLLMNAYNLCNSKQQKDSMLVGFHGSKQVKITSLISKKISAFFNDDVYPVEEKEQDIE